MKSNKHILTVLAALVCILFSSTGFAEETSNTVLEKKTLKRWVDPVIMEGRLANAVIGKPIANLRLYIFKDGKFEPIRYQIDEMTGENGDWVFTSGPQPNIKLANGIFDSWDKLLFMALDTGNRAAKDAWPSGCTAGSEIEVTDPLTGEKGWCYLFYFASNVPPKSSLPNYVSYDYATEKIDTEYFGSEYIITKDGLHSTYYKKYYIKKAAGGNGENVVDRLKIRINVKMLFGSVALHFDEELLKSDVLAYTAGPIQLLRRLEQYVKLPGGLKSLRVLTDTMHYRNTATVPVMFNIPFQLNRVVSSAVVRFGTDYNEKAFGAKLYNSNNPQGFLVDGKMDHSEQNFNPGVDKWRLITGDIGTYMTRTIFTPKILQDIKITMGIIDDVTQKYPPETYPGTIGYLYQDWNVGGLKRGTYYLYVEFYHPPFYKSGDEVQYVNYMDHPLTIVVGDQKGQSQALLLPTIGKNYK